MRQLVLLALLSSPYADEAPQQASLDVEAKADVFADREKNVANNVIQNANDFSSGWGCTRCTTGGSSDQGGGYPLIGIIGDTNNNNHNVNYDTGENLTAATWTASMVCAPGNKTWVWFRTINGNAPDHYFDLATCAAGATGSGTLSTFAEPYGDGCKVGYTFTGTTAAHRPFIYPADDNGDITFAGDGSTINVYCGQVQYELGGRASQYVDN